MRESTVLAAFDSFSGIEKVPTAVLAKGIERAVAEEAVEKLLVCAAVAGEIFAVFIAEV